MRKALLAQCGSLPEAQQAECRREAERIVEDMLDAKYAIKDKGGAHKFRVLGESCDECAEHAVSNFQHVWTYFDYEARQNVGWFDTPLGGPAQHCWGVVVFKGPSGDGPRSDEKPVDIGIIDFWLNGEDDFWYSPEEHDWEPSDTTVLGEWFE
jgi:hypothetical protein